MRLALFGAAPDTLNMGVSALFTSAITGISRYLEQVEFVAFDNGFGRRETTIKTPYGKEVRIIRFGARGGRRYYRPENLATMLLASRLGASGARLNEGIRLIDSCVAVLDVSGGDSFSDIYGRARFDLIYRPKAIAISRHKPLILLPQTYGPYKKQEVRDLAASVVHSSAMAWARDSHSFEILRGLLGDEFNPEIHRCGTDMAFSLLPNPADHLLSPALKDWLRSKPSEFPLVGFNISGLIYNDPGDALMKYGFKADYRQVVIDFLNNLLAETRCRVVLISHVMDQPGHFESDFSACNDVATQLGTKYAGRVIVAPVNLDQSQVKWLITHMDWFCGTRMHSTIGGLSSCIPTATISYSDKAKGVFETCGQAGQVMDPRQMNANAIAAALRRSFNHRIEIRKSLTDRMPSVKELAEHQIQEIVRKIQSLVIS